jgi:hypothetical protein
MFHRRDHEADPGPVLGEEEVFGLVLGQPQPVTGQRSDIHPQPALIQCARRFRLIELRETVSADTDRVTCEAVHVAEQPAGGPGTLGPTQWLLVDVLQDRP